MKLDSKVYSPAQLADAMTALHKKHFDFLVTIVGEDFGEEGLGCVYILENTDTHERISVKSVNPDRQEPWLPTVSHLWKAAELLEREVYDFYGIVFTGHPDMRRLYLRSDFQGFPFRKDYQMPKDKPFTLDDDPEPNCTCTYTLDEDGHLQAHSRKLFSDDEYVINIGPQHPATHGVLRLQTVLDGETIRRIYPHCGYIHRGIEKMCEEYTYPQTLALTDRLDYLSAMMNRHALCAVIEEAMGIELSDRIKYIRVMMDELQRLDSHLLFYSCCAQDLGGLTAFIYGMRDREQVLNVMEETTGGRLIQNYYRIGGCQDDIDANFAENVKKLCAYMKPMFKEYDDIFTGNVILQNRFKQVGVLSKENAISYGCTGGTGRAAGWHCDVRKNHPYDIYDKIDFDEITFSNGDSFDRYMVRMEEMRQSVKILETLADNIPAGDFYIKQKPVIRVPEGQWYTSCEGSRGEIGVYLDSKGDKSPYRLKLRPMGLPLVSALDEILKGEKIADLIAVGASLDYVIPDIDR
ncbi:MAG: NADH-quinone oxidoreductase subunit D [Prevotella sp.]|jgi:NADH:ubiquinone oxidoreductase 49 kD subunit 7|nr:NADH-quinone oxidoreductase subunit D [Prevotella sp.]